MSDTEQSLKAQIVIGEDGARFLASDLGRTMIGLAGQELDAALDELEKADVKDEKKMLELQNKVRFARRFPGWMNELIAEAEEAMQILDGKRHTD